MLNAMKPCRSAWSALLLTGLLCMSSAAQSVVSGTLVAILEGNLPSGGLRVPITNGIYHRQVFNAMGGRIILNAYEWDASLGAFVWAIGIGDTLKFVWRDSESGNVIGEKSNTYLGGESSCWSSGHCGKITEWTSLFVVQCTPEKSNIELEVYFNNVMFGASSVKPTRFHPAARVETFPENIRPKSYSFSEGGVADISLVIEDNLGCGEKIPETIVRMETYVVPDTNGHGYDMGKNGIGTGRFIPAGYEAVVNPDEDEGVEETVIQGVTDKDGIIKVQYQARDHALMENLSVKLKRPAEDGAPEIVVTDTSDMNLKISVQGLQLLTSSNGYFSFRDFGSCQHSAPVNYVTPAFGSVLISASAVYYAKTGMRISLNDASLPWGGVIANFVGSKKQGGTLVSYSGGRDAPCHKSHRFGIDIDVNKNEWLSANQPGRDINVETVVEGQRTETALEYLTSLMRRYGACRVYEEPIHYRYHGSGASCR